MKETKVIILLPEPNEMLIRCNLEDFKDPVKMLRAYLNMKARIETNLKETLPMGKKDVYSIN